MDLGVGEVGNERLDKDGRLLLADERRGGGDDGLGAGHAQAPEEEDGISLSHVQRLAYSRESGRVTYRNDPLQNAPVIKLSSQVLAKHRFF